MKPIKTLTVGGETYQITDPEAAKIDDNAVAPDQTWSSKKIAHELGDIKATLDSIIAIPSAEEVAF